MANKGYKWYNNGTEQRMFAECPEGWSKGRVSSKTPPWNKGIKWKKKNNTQVPWNKGKKGVSEETSRKMSESAKARGMDHIDNAGKTPWNKGKNVPNLTKGQKRPHGNYVKGSEHPNWREDQKEFDGYKVRVRYLTEKVYKENSKKINPNNYNRVRAGSEGYQLDHIVSISEAYELGWKPERVASIDNLQMLPWKENLIKGGTNRK